MTTTKTSPRNVRKAKAVKTVSKSDAFDPNRIAKMLATASAEQLKQVATVSKTIAAEKQKAAKAVQARARIAIVKAGHASLSSELYKNKRGNISRKVFLRSDQLGSYGKGTHQTCFMEQDIAALARLIENCGADSLAEIILAAKADQDAHISA